MMKHSNANTTLPKELLLEIQQYVQGKLIYIPIKKGNYKKWGEITKGKSITSVRNDKIRFDFNCGYTVNELCEKYGLSLSSIKKIVYGK